jgi:hypothetical protein
MCRLSRKSGLLGGWRTLQDVGHFTGVVQATTRVPKRKVEQHISIQFCLEVYTRLNQICSYE